MERIHWWLLTTNIFLYLAFKRNAATDLANNTLLRRRIIFRRGKISRREAIGPLRDRYHAKVNSEL